MKNILLICLLFVLPHIVLAKKYESPKISATEAIEAAKDYVVSNNIVISDASFITKILYRNIYNEYAAAYWSVNWHAVPNIKGGWIEIRIYNNGKIEPRYGE